MYIIDQKKKPHQNQGKQAKYKIHMEIHKSVVLLGFVLLCSHLIVNTENR